jgi:hypothetical protein
VTGSFALSLLCFFAVQLSEVRTPVTSLASQPQTDKRVLEAAGKALEARRYGEAQRLLEPLAARGSADAYMLLGVVLMTGEPRTDERFFLGTAHTMAAAALQGPAALDAMAPMKATMSADGWRKLEQKARELLKRSGHDKLIPVRVEQESKEKIFADLRRVLEPRAARGDADAYESIGIAWIRREPPSDEDYLTGAAHLRAASALGSASSTLMVNTMMEEMTAQNRRKVLDKARELLRRSGQDTLIPGGASLKPSERSLLFFGQTLADIPRHTARAYDGRGF